MCCVCATNLLYIIVKHFNLQLNLQVKETILYNIVALKNTIRKRIHCGRYFDLSAFFLVFFDDLNDDQRNGSKKCNDDDKHEQSDPISVAQ